MIDDSGMVYKISLHIPPPPPPPHTHTHTHTLSLSPLSSLSSLSRSLSLIYLSLSLSISLALALALSLSLSRSPLLILSVGIWKCFTQTFDNGSGHSQYGITFGLNIFKIFSHIYIPKGKEAVGRSFLWRLRKLTSVPGTYILDMDKVIYFTIYVDI